MTAEADKEHIIKIEEKPADASAAASDYDKVDTQEVAMISVNRVRITYGAILVGGFILCFLVKTDIFQWITKWEIRKTGNCTDQECVGDQGVYRVSFSLFLFFFLHWLCTSPWNLCMEPTTRMKFNQQGFFIKIICLIPLLIVSFVIPNDFFVFFAWLSVVLSVLFLIGQLIILLDFAYGWSEDWANREEPKYLTGLMVCTGFLTVAAIVLIGLSYYWFGSDKACGLQQGMISTTLVAAVLYFPLSIAAPSGSLVPSSVVFAYTTYTCFSALSTLDSGVCNRIHTNGTTSLVMGAVFSGAALVYATVNAATSRDAFALEQKDETVEEAEANSFAFFYVQMMLGSAYLSMLLTNWTVTGSTSMATMAGSTLAPTWAKFSSELVCLVLYLWSLVAPMVCKDRNFG